MNKLLHFIATLAIYALYLAGLFYVVKERLFDKETLKYTGLISQAVMVSFVYVMGRSGRKY